MNIPTEQEAKIILDNNLELPQSFELEPTNTCNIKCKMCHVPYMANIKKEYFDISLLSKLEPESLKDKWVSVGSVYEPSIHAHFPEIIQYFSDIGCKIDLTTNGTMFSERLINQIVHCKMGKVTFSCDSINKRTYESIRQNARFDRTIDRILSYRKALNYQKDTCFVINAVLMNSNIDQIIEMLDFWEAHDFHHLGLILMVIRAQNEDLSGEVLDDDKEYAIRKLNEAAEYVIKNNLKITISNSCFETSELFKGEYSKNLFGSTVFSDNPENRGVPFTPKSAFQHGEYPGMRVNCKSPFIFAKILYDGSIQICDKFNVGNLKEQNFKDIWYGEKAQRIRLDILTNPKICYSCDFYRFCLNAAHIDQENEDNNYADLLVEDQPTLLCSYNEYNIIKFKKDIYGLPHKLGPIDFNIYYELSHPDIIKATTEDIVKRLIDRRLSPLSKLKISAKKIFQRN